MSTPGVTIRSIRALRGPNLYATMPVLRVELDIGPYEERPSTSFPGFVERLTAWLPGLHAHTCSLGRPGGFVERLQRGTYLAHICEHVALELQSLMGFDVSLPMTYSNVHESQSNDCLALCDVRLHILPAGYRFDLAERQPLLEREEGK